MNIQVTFVLDDDDGDPDDETGMTEDQYVRLMAAIPGYDVEIERLD